MLLALLLLTRAAAEWVEISQQHYRKPVRTTPAEPTRTTFQTQTPRYPEQNLQDSVKNPYQNEATRNYDVFIKPERDDFVTQDRPRNPTANFNFDRDVHPVRINPFLQDVSLQSPAKIPHEDFSHIPTRDIQHYVKQESTTDAIYPNRSIAENNWNSNIQRLGNGRGDVKIPAKVTNYDNWNDNNGDRIDEIIRKTDVSNTRIKDETVPGKIERVPSIGSVKRVELSSTPVKSPAVNKISEKNINRRKNVNPYEDKNYDSLSDELDVKTNIFDPHEHFKKASIKPTNFNQYHSSTEEVFTELYSKKRKSPIDGNKDPIPSVHRYPITYTSEKVEFPNSDQNSVPDNIESTMHTVGNQIYPLNSSVKLQHKFTANTDTLSGFVTKNDEFIESVKEVDKSNIKSDNIRNQFHGSVKVEKVYKEKDSTEKDEDTSSSSEVKVNTMEKILKFMKVVADTISKNTRKGANGKVAYLNELKHSLLDNIKSRIDATFPDEDGSARRRSRSASPRGHVEFPSSESALMTISFLTFAVFLIKLVLQVIQTYKHKTMVMAPLVVATAGRNIATKLRGNS